MTGKHLLGSLCSLSLVLLCFCACIPATLQAQGSDKYCWVAVSGDPQRLSLFTTGLPSVRIGEWRFDSGTFHPAVPADSLDFGPAADLPWGAPRPPQGMVPTDCCCAKKTSEPGCAGDCCDDCPCGKNCTCRQNTRRCSPGCRCVIASQVKANKDNKDGKDDVGEWRYHGVEVEQLSTTPRFLRRGRTITRDEALKAVTGKDLPDDGKKLCLTIVSRDAESRKQVESDLTSAPELLAVRNQVRLQSYDATHPLIATYGFVTSGTPTIYLQNATGEVLHRQDEYRGPRALAQAIATAAEAIRKADPNYDPAKDPDLNRLPIPVPGPIPLPTPGIPLWVLALWAQIEKIPLVAWVLIGLAILLFLKK